MVISGIKRYKSIDVVIWTVLLFVFELIVVRAGSVWFPSQPWSLSIVPALVAIMYMRWGLFGVFYSILGGIVISYSNHAGFEEYVIYCLGNAFSVGAMLLLKKVGKERIQSKVSLSLIYTMLVVVLMQLGRGLVALCFGEGIGALVDFVATDILSWAFALVVIWIARKLDGVFEDQMSYLIRIKTDEEEKGGEK